MASSPIDTLLARLELVKPTGPGRWLARCPAHQDRRASLSVRELDDGRLLVHCFAGCASGDVLAAVGLQLADLFPDRRPYHAPPTRARVPAADALRALLLEASVAHIAAEDVAAGRALSAEDRARLELAVTRLAAGVARCADGR